MGLSTKLGYREANQIYCIAELCSISCNPLIGEQNQEKITDPHTIKINVYHKRKYIKKLKKLKS